jgi:penicillin-binding protein 1C
LLLQANSAARSCLRLDDKPVARCGKNMVLMPLPAPGKHVLLLTDAKGEQLDKHVFEVRGLGAKPGGAAKSLP